jgi:hypothetical protein
LPSIKKLLNYPFENCIAALFLGRQCCFRPAKAWASPVSPNHVDWNVKSSDFKSSADLIARHIIEYYGQYSGESTHEKQSSCGQRLAAAAVGKSGTERMINPHKKCPT